MEQLGSMLHAEALKALRSRMPLWTALGSLFMPLGIGFLIWAARNPGLSQKLGLISAKANLVAYAGTDWHSYLGLSGMMLAAGGFILYVLAISWVFGREFVDGTLKDMLAVPVPRATILLAKFAVAALWSLALSLVIMAFVLSTGALIGLPGASAAVLARGILLMLACATLTIVVVLPFALLASVGRGYLLPLGLAVATVMLTNFVALAGWGPYFPWAVPGLLAQPGAALEPVSYWIVFLTGLAGMLATYLWWMFADQNK